MNSVRAKRLQNAIEKGKRKMKKNAAETPRMKRVKVYRNRTE